jgi:hypothetical protein
MKMTDWLGKAIGLPPAFLFEGGTNGGGCIQANASHVGQVFFVSLREESYSHGFFSER